MSDTIELTAEIRTTVGKGASRRLRRLEDKVPAIIYGGEGEAQMLTLSANELSKAMQIEAFYSQILSLSIAGNAEAETAFAAEISSPSPSTLGGHGSCRWCISGME